IGPYGWPEYFVKVHNRAPGFIQTFHLQGWRPFDVEQRHELSQYAIMGRRLFSILTQQKETYMKVVQFAQYGGPEVLRVYEAPDPIPGPTDVLVQVKATTVNHLDLFQRDGSRPVGKLPFTPGLEAAGVVERDSAGFHAGERVMTTRAIAAKGGG